MKKPHPDQSFHLLQEDKNLPPRDRTTCHVSWNSKRWQKNVCRIALRSLASPSMCCKSDVHHLWTVTMALSSENCSLVVRYSCNSGTEQQPATVSHTRWMLTSADCVHISCNHRWCLLTSTVVCCYKCLLFPHHNHHHRPQTYRVGQKSQLLYCDRYFIG